MQNDYVDGRIAISNPVYIMGVLIDLKKNKLTIST